MLGDEQKQIGLEDILITEELSRRSPRTPDLQAENSALHTLARQLAQSPQTMLKTLVAVARDLCQAGTAGVSLLEVSSTGEEIFRWVAIAGVLEQYEQGTTPGDFSPCQVCLERRAPQLFLYPERYFTYFQQVKPASVESLVIPLVIDEQPLGTLWILSDDQQRQFDTEDVRLMSNLADFTAAALQSSRARQSAKEAQQALHQNQAQMQSLITNMPGMVYRYIACANGEERFTFVNSGCYDLFEVEPQAALQDAFSIWNLIHPDDLSSFQASVATAVENFLSWDWQGRIITPSGQLKWIHGRSSAVQTPEGAAWDGWLIDISDRKQVEEALRESEEFNRSIFESSADCIKILDLNGCIISINHPGMCLLEIEDCTPLLGTPWIEFWQDSYQDADKAVKTALSGTVGRFSGYWPTFKGTPKWWDVMVAPVLDSQSNPKRLVVTSRDITASIQAQEALRDAHVQLESALAAGAVYTWRWNIADNRLTTNAAFAHLFGVDPVGAAKGLPLETFVNAIHLEDRPQVLAAINRAIETGEEYIAEYRVRTATGEERWVTARGRVEYDAVDRPVAFPGALVDITYLKQAEEALRQSEERYRTLFESIDDGFCVIEMLFDENDIPLDYRFLEVNPAFEKQTGLVQVEGKRMLQLAPTHEKYWFEIYGKIAMTGEPVRVEHRAEALQRWYEVYACRIGQQESRKIAVLFKDISDRKQIEAEREKILQQEQTARETAERANRIKDEFLAVLSHELRSPLNPILGWSSLLRSGRLDAAKTAHALETIERNAKLQVQLIEDLLDVSRILHGKFSLNTVPVNLAATITAALETVRLAAQAKSIQIQTMLDPTVGQVLGDSARLQQVIWNLLSNAIKFTPEGKLVKIELKSVGLQAQIQVSDTGIGIHPDFLTHVFEYFRQADSKTTRTFGGLGLGLAIVRHLVELHGGTVRADSPGVGQGATFTVQIPLAPQSNELSVPKSSAPTNDLSGIQILVVDDEADSREFIAFVLEQANASVTTVASGIDALQAFSQSIPDILISDIGMPQMDGYMLLRQIRTLPLDRGGQVPAIALTAYAGEIDRQQAIAAGFQRHIAKPIDPDAIIAIVVQLTRL